MNNQHKQVDGSLISDHLRGVIQSFNIQGKRYIAEGILRAGAQDSTELESAIQFAVASGLPVSIRGVLYTGDNNNV